MQGFEINLAHRLNCIYFRSYFFNLTTESTTGPLSPCGKMLCYGFRLPSCCEVWRLQDFTRCRDTMPHNIVDRGSGAFKHGYGLLNLRALKSSTLYINCIVQCMGKMFFMGFQRYLCHTLKDVKFVEKSKFRSCYIYELVSVFGTTTTPHPHTRTPSPAPTSPPPPTHPWSHTLHQTMICILFDFPKRSNQQYWIYARNKNY